MDRPSALELRAFLARHGLTQSDCARILGRGDNPAKPRSVNRWCSETSTVRIPFDAAVRLWALMGETWPPQETEKYATAPMR
jgi:hypothetical protein